MNIQDFNYLIEDPASVSWSVKLVALVSVLGFILFMGYQLLIVDRAAALDAVQSKESELKQTLEARQRRASQIVVYEKQLEEMQYSFGNLLQQLPSGTEIPALIIDISEKGVSNGLEVELFEPLAEIQKEFYAEKPIKIIALGSYRQLAMFVSDISGLPRIVTIHDISLKPLEVDEKNKTVPTVTQSAVALEDMKVAATRLRMEATIKTYRYLEGSIKKDTPTESIQK